MQYRISHTTKYEYAESVPFCQNVVYLTPRSTSTQSVTRHRLTLSPKPATSHRRLDYFGNTAHILSVDTSHRLLQITASSTVQLQSRPPIASAVGPAWETVTKQLINDRSPDGLDNYQYTFCSPHVPYCEPLKSYASSSFTAGRPLGEAVAELNQRIYSDFQYDPAATTVSTPISEVFEQRRGVCQDLAHVMLGCLRSIGVAARYVSGYLRTIPAAGQPRLTGSDASHAWVSVFCGPAGWVDVDPTNNVFTRDDHITVAWGRDYSDVCPVAGMFVGGGTQLLSVAVDVVPNLTD